ncbi:MAG: lysine 2,3-aminomutase, partial [Verrucomicrobiota bacterium]|nr:lysine 2,3-aminomutase [Verrucomicrobiota bacterium]
MAEYRANTRNDLHRIGKMLGLNCDQIIDMQAVSAVLPFRVNDYVVKNLIDRGNLPDDPIFQLTFPQREMLADEDFKSMRDLVSGKASESEIHQAALKVRQKLNPHPAGQLELNKPKFDDDTLEGVQHKYNETVLFFPAQGQTCHAYGTSGFRWAQFIGDKNLRFASKEADQLVQYVRDNPQISSVLITGGDPMVMKTKLLRQYIAPLLDIPHLDSIRVGTKALAYWPHRFIQGEDADDFLRLIEQVRAADKHFALMAHSSHPRELEPAPARGALRRVISAGATVRCQAPLIKHVNDHQDIWADLW